MKSARTVLTHPATGILSFRSPGNYFPGFVPLIVIYMHTVCAAATLFVTEEQAECHACRAHLAWPAVDALLMQALISVVY